LPMVQVPEPMLHKPRHMLCRHTGCVHGFEPISFHAYFGIGLHESVPA
jgi:hypothetical protein